MANKRVAKRRVAATAADAVDEQLARYRSMRDFGVTAEPSGKGAASFSKSGELPFVIQKHAASHLHYDFRLGWNGVLKSWAVAKGPSYFPGDKRLAVEVEDHPIKYGGFEGVIPQGQYGGGTVMVWDQGTWTPQDGHPDVAEGLCAGSLKFTMHGTKMKGRWTLVRMGGKAAREKKPNWLLIKEHDEFERGKDAPCITEEAPSSVVTGRSLEEIAGNEDHVWNSKETAKGNAWHRVQKGIPAEKKAQAAWPELATLPKESVPEFVAPELALQAAVTPEGEGWLHELKLDGYRMQARKDGTSVKLLTRSGLDWTHRMPTIAAQVGALPVERTVLDGEVVVLAENGTTSFAELQAAFQDGAKKGRAKKEAVKAAVTYFVFDLLHLDGRSARGLPLVERKALLARVLEGAGEGLRLSEHLATSGAAIFAGACRLRAEGIISKRAASAYISGRGGDWLKVKCIRGQEFVVGGYTLPANGSKDSWGVGALLLGYYEGKKLIYAGRTGTGFTQKTHRMLRERLEGLAESRSPFEAVPAEARRGVQWVRPELVAQVNFATWTAEKLLRQAAFQGLREDKMATEVRREDAVSVASEEKTEAKKAGGKKATEQGAVRLTHPEKVLDAASGLTKERLAAYYGAVSERMLPQIAGRPLSLVRCPEGSERPCFYQKHTNHALPAGVESIDVPDKKTGKMEPYLTLATAEALMGLAQMGVMEVHPWGSRNDDLERPDRLIIDLDPDEAVGWKELAASAAEVRRALQALGLESFLKLTGGKGLHVVVPIEPEHDWAAVKAFAHAFVRELERAKPTVYLTKMSKTARKGRIYLDYLRNERGATAVAAFSPRARAGAAVSLPLEWSELRLVERPVFRAAEVAEWKGRLKKDPWKKMTETQQRISREMLEALQVSAKG